MTEKRCNTCKHFRTLPGYELDAGTKHERGHCQDPRIEKFWDIEEAITSGHNGADCQGWTRKEPAE